MVRCLDKKKDAERAIARRPFKESPIVPYAFTRRYA